MAEVLGGNTARVERDGNGLPGTGLMRWGFAPILVLFVFIAVFAVRSIHSSIEGARWVDHTHALRVAIGELNTAYYRVRVPWRNFMIHGDAASLAEFNREAGSLPSIFNALQSHALDNPAQQNRLRAIERFLLQDLGAMSASVTKRMAGGIDDPVAEITRVMAQELWRHEISQLIFDVQAQEENLLAERRAQWESDARLAYVVIIGGNIAGFVMLIAIFVLLQRENRTRHAAQESMRRYSDEIKDLYNNSPCGYHSLDVDGMFVRINDTELAWLGYGREEIVGRRKFPELLTAESAARFVRWFPKFKQTGRAVDLEYDLVRRDGSIFPVSLSASAVRDAAGNYLMSRSTMFDITERRRAELALRRSEEDMRLLQTATLAISQAQDADAAFAVLIGKACDFVGWSYGQAWLPAADGARLLLGPAWYSRTREFAEFRRRNEALGTATPEGLLNQVWTSKRPCAEWHLTPDPRYARRRPLMLEAGFRAWMGVPVLAGEEVIAVIEFFHNASHEPDERILQVASILATQLGPVIQRKRAEDEVRSLNEELRRSAERLEATNRELESFSYSVSHDLRAPLRAIDGFSRMLEEDYAGKLDGDARRYIGVVRENAQKMGRLIDDLLEFSRLGRKPLSVSAVDMTALVREIVEKLDPPEGRPLPEVEVRQLPAAACDQTLIRQVWVNLLSNAVKFSGRRDVPRVEVSGTCDGADLVYRVSDNGAGFDMRYYDKLFGVFQRLHSAEEFPGTGVGLAIVQRVVARHGGRVWAEGEIGRGAIFHFSLPGEHHDV